MKLIESRELVDADGKPRKAGIPTTAISPTAGIRANPHTVLDIHWTAPRGVTCKCGWAAGAATIDEVERLWKLHQKGVAA